MTTDHELTPDERELTNSELDSVAGGFPWIGLGIVVLLAEAGIMTGMGLAGSNPCDNGSCPEMLGALRGAVGM